MKHTNLIHILIAFLFIFQGCKKDFLELEPLTNQSEANYYKTESDAFYALTGIYQAMAVHNGYECVPLAVDIFSDDAFCGGASATDMAQWHQMENDMVTSENSTAAQQWKRCYFGIYRANLLLSKFKQIEWTDSAHKARFNAEVKFCRAYFYWDLARLFGWVPVFNEYLPNYLDYSQPIQNTPAEVYKQIASDLLEAINGLPKSLPDEEKGRATCYAAKALAARIYLYYQGFVKPVMGVTTEWSSGAVTIDKKYVQDALDSVIIKGGYQLLPKYADVFSWENQNNAESIFELQYSEKGKCGNWNDEYWDVYGNLSVIMCGIRDPKGDNTLSGGWSFCTMSWSLADEYESGDPRKDVTLYDADNNLTDYTKAYQNTGYFNRKFLPQRAYDATSGSRELNYPRNYMDIRFSDVLLMASELFLNDDPGKSLDYFNRVRKRALGEGAAKTSITIDDIYHERRVELAGEGQRYWDLLRRGLDYTEQKIQESVVLPSDITNATHFADIKFNKNTWGMYPIPATEIRKVKAGSLKQYIPAYK